MIDNPVITFPTDDQVKQALADGGLERGCVYWINIDRRVVKVMITVDAFTSYKTLYEGKFPHMRRSIVSHPYKFSNTHPGFSIVSEYWCFTFHWEDESEVSS